MIVQAPEPQPNDLYIIPAGKGESRGHIGLIVAIGKHYDFETGAVSDYCMAYESAMFPDDPSFKYKVGRCKYRLFCYEKSWLQNATFIRCISNK